MRAFVARRLKHPREAIRRRDAQESPSRELSMRRSLRRPSIGKPWIECGFDGAAISFVIRRSASDSQCLEASW